jgi:ribosomal protein S18 acetylase RimI-like enzyme
VSEFRFEPLWSQDVSAFSSGEPSLDTYLKNSARDDIARKLASVHLAIDCANDEVAGFYAISSYGVIRSELSKKLRGKYPYPMLPAFLIGQLARDINYFGKSVGEVLLLDALERCYGLTGVVGGVAIVVEAINDHATAFYRRYGFESLSDGSDRRLYIPMKVVEKLYQREPVKRLPI